MSAADGEEHSFRSATEAFNDKFYERAEGQFGAFTTNFPTSTNWSRAVLFQAQARHLQKQYDGAIELLKAHQGKAGTLADQYALTLGEALSGKGEPTAAAEQYSRILKEFPNSPLRLQAAYHQALSRYEQKNFAGTIELLLPGESDFKKLSAAVPQDRFSFAGNLLLADALLAAGRVPEARDVATALPNIGERPEWQWERFDMLARVELAGTNTPAAVTYLTNAAAAALTAQQPRLQAQSINLEAEAYRKMGQAGNAITAYEKIASNEALPIDQRRLAVLKTVELLSGSGDVINAIRRLETYLSGMTNDPAADLLKVKAGELWIEQARNLGRTGNRMEIAVAGVTNALAQARGHLNGVIVQFTNSTHVGRAWLNLGWTFWEEGLLLEQSSKVQESETAFRTASEKLTRSDDQALAIFKRADSQMYLGQDAAAATNYLRVLKEYADLSQVKNALFNKAHAQLIRAYLQVGEVGAAESALAELRAAFPKSPETEESLFRVAQAAMGNGNTEKARTLLQEFLKEYPLSPLAGEVRFAEARTYSAEGDFKSALERHETWLQSHTNHRLRAEVEFQRGMLLDKAGQTTNALEAFTNFAARYATSVLAPAAQMWVADHYLSLEQLPRAELNYQRVFQNTNWANSSLAYQSRMMAARTAFRRQGYNDARSYLTTLLNDPKCPPELKPEAWYALGDIFLEEPITGSTNALHNFTQAAVVFERVATQYPTNTIALLATARKGDCYFQIAAHTNYADSYIVASNAYSTVLRSKAELPIKVRNQAEFGLARVLERMADGKPESERAALRKGALNHFLNIIYGEAAEGQKADPFYLKLAGREAGRLAEELGDVEAAIQLYQRLSEEAPAAKSLWESRITLLQNGKERKSRL
ncbi:MAG: tetratricopeptide repeat protein [Limisphaerales bacterium]